MTTPAEKQNRAAKRGCLWLLIGTPTLLLIYLILLSTSLFDSRPQSYPDLEIQPEGKTIPLLEALESSPEWADWKADEEARADLHYEINSLIRKGAPIPPDMIAKARIEVARARRIVEGMLAIEETFWPCWVEKGGRLEFVGMNHWPELIVCLGMQLPDQAQHPKVPMNRTAPSSMSLRFLGKNRMASESSVGRTLWLGMESKTHGALLSDILRAQTLADHQGLRNLLKALEESRPSEFPAIAVALGGDLKFTAIETNFLRSQLGASDAHVSEFGTPTRSEVLLHHWMVLRMQPNRCVDHVANIARAFVAQAHFPANTRTYPDEPDIGIARHFSLAPNAGGEVRFSREIDSYRRLLASEDHGLARHHLLRLLIGLALYRIDHENQLPPDLAALVPAYLPELPKDPYTGEPPLYDPAAGKLAFRGMDFVPSSAPVDAEAEKKSRQRGLPPGVAGLFEREGPHDPGADLNAFFGAVEQPEP